MTTYYSIHTTIGLAALAEAELSNIPINLTEMAVGDGFGNPVIPAESMTALVREKYRESINRVYKPDPTGQPTLFAAELVIPASEGGFTMREVGIFDADGDMMVIGNLPDTYKPVVADGAYSDTVVRVLFQVSNASTITIISDPNVVVVTQQWIENNVNACYIIPGGTTGQILKKASNTCGDVEWGDPDVADVLVSTTEEEQTLAASQTDVEWATVTTTGLAVYIEGVRIPYGAGAGKWTKAPAPDDGTTIVLGSTYPDGTKIVGVQNDPASAIGNPLQKAQNLADLDNAATARTNLGVYSKAETDQKAPAGMVAHFAMSSAPTGWLKANGAVISRTTYATLFAAIGTTFNTGGEAGTDFRLPDLRGEFLRGWDDSRGIDTGRALGSYQADEFKSHSHSFGGYNFIGGAGNYVGATGETNVQNKTYTTSSAGGAETRPRNIAMLACIKF